MCAWCMNDPCETEATHFYITSGGAVFCLCYTCKEAFELGQVNDDADLRPVEELHDKCSVCKKSPLWHKDIELVTTLCGEQMCRDCADEHRQECTACDAEAAASYGDYLRKREKEGW